MAAVEPRDERFEYPKHYTPERHTEGTFGLIDGPTTRVELVVRNPGTLGYLEARRIHPTQRFRRRRDGTALLTLELRGTTELANWVLAHTPWIEVQRPEALRQEVAARLREAAAMYGPAGRC